MNKSLMIVSILLSTACCIAFAAPTAKPYSRVDQSENSDALNTKETTPAKSSESNERYKRVRAKAHRNAAKARARARAQRAADASQ